MARSQNRWKQGGVIEKRICGMAVARLSLSDRRHDNWKEDTSSSIYIPYIIDAISCRSQISMTSKQERVS